MQLDPVLTLPAIIAAIATMIALVSAYFSFLGYRKSQRQYIADLHSDWWGHDFENDRAIVWEQLELWELSENKAESPAIQHYTTGNYWKPRDQERRAHGRLLFFFADLNTFINYRLVDPDLAFELFGVAQYDWFRLYIQALIAARKTRLTKSEGKPMLAPRWIKDIEQFERRLDAWKISKL
ncbi:hypothetical protein ACVINW_001398 [Bradyrhizobium sp. USDA 4461]